MPRAPLLFKETFMLGAETGLLLIIFFLGPLLYLLYMDNINV